MNKLEQRIILALALVAALLLALLLLRPEKEPEVIRGEFTPPPFDPAAVTGTPSLTAADRFGTLQLNPELAVCLCSSPVVEDGQARVFFTSPATNTAWVRLRLLDANGSLLGQTGLLRPGEYVECVALTANPKQPEAIARILTYEPDTWYSLGSASAQIMLDFKR